ncbi:MAG: RagB/SusD family nutrient uptake outer membrane protein [Muribaculaceae bacterium]
MKRNNIIKGLAAITITGCLASCSSDYLDLAPKSEISNKDVTTSVTAIRLAAYGVFKSQYMQYGAYYGFRWFNGEPWLSAVYGDVTGGDYISYFWQRSSPTIVDWQAMSADNYTSDIIPWSYCYGIISQCNTILSSLEADAEPTGEIAFRIAQAYTMRAHAYSRLLQIFGPRWADAKGGSELTVPLRLKQPDPADTQMTRASMGDVLKTIYNDLDNALELYAKSGVKRTYAWEADASVAKGVYARAALLKDDWATAQKMAHEARQGYGIMSADTYVTCGFAKNTSETMWAVSDDYSGIYYASYGATYACNGAYPTLWGSTGGGAISMDLYRKLDAENDVRASLFFTPDKVSEEVKPLFYTAGYTAAASMNVNVLMQLEDGTITGTPLQKELQKFAEERYAACGRLNGWSFPYAVAGEGTQIADPATGATLTQFGAQFKFWGIDGYSSCAYNMMRASEMLLIEAEAACHNSQEAVAKSCLDELNANRINGWKGTDLTGDALLEEIKVARRIELWGEGFNFFDFKRWNQPIERRVWVAGDATSGNWPSVMVGEGTFQTSKSNGWRWVIPQNESQYNTAVKGNNQTPDPKE